MVSNPALFSGARTRSTLTTRLQLSVYAQSLQTGAEFLGDTFEGGRTAAGVSDDLVQSTRTALAMSAITRQATLVDMRLIFT